MTEPDSDALLFDVTTPQTPVERLLNLADLYTQYNDELDLGLGSDGGPDPMAHSAAARHLARETEAAIRAVTDQQPYVNPSLTDALVRLKQLAYLSARSADHNPRLARELTALAPAAVVDSTAQITAETQRRSAGTSAIPGEPLTAAQQSILGEIARGHVVLTTSLGREYVHSHKTRVPIGALRHLETTGLIERRASSAAPAFQGGPPQDRVHLTQDGRTALAAALSLAAAKTTTVHAAPPVPHPADQPQPMTASCRRPPNAP